MVLSNIQCISLFLLMIFNFFSYSILCNLFTSPSDVLKLFHDIFSLEILTNNLVVRKFEVK